MTLLFTNRTPEKAQREACLVERSRTLQSVADAGTLTLSLP